MKRILRCDRETLQKYPNIFRYVRDNFEDDSVEMYVYSSDDEKSLGFVASNGLFSILVKNDMVVPFRLNEKGELDAVVLNGISYSFENNFLYVVSSDGKIESSLSIDEVNEEDLDAPEALVTFKQYSYDSDTMCTMVYRNVYRPRDGYVPIYSFHLKDIDSLYIDHNFLKNDFNPKAGILKSDRQYFARYEIDYDTLGYFVMAIREYGLLEVFSRGAYGAVGDPKVVRYAKCKFVLPNGDYKDTFPFTKLYTTSMIDDVIKENGFSLSVPEDYLDIYNRSNMVVEEIRELISLMRNLPLDEKEDKKVLLKVYED